MNPNSKFRLKHTREFLMARIERASYVHAAAFVRIEVYDHTWDHERAWQAFRAAVTEWARTTDNGRELWIESVEDLNIGDLTSADVLDTDEFMHIAATHGISNVDAQGLTHGGYKTYDEILVDPAD